MNTAILIGNICPLLAMGTDSLSTTRKTTKGMLWVQNISQVIYGVGTAVLGGYSGAVQNLVSIVRNMVAICDIKSQTVEWILVAAGVVLGILCNNLGLVGLLPMIANLQYTLVVFRFKDNQVALKISFAVTCLLFAIFNFAIYNFVGVVTNLVVVATTTLVLLKGKKAEAK